MNQTHTTRAIVYRRASTDEDTQIHSLNRQEVQIEQFCANHNYEIVETFSEYASAYKGHSRPQFQKALKKLAKDPDLVLLVNDLTRLSRSLEGYGDWKKFLPQIRFASLGNKTVEPLVAELLLVVAANESRVLGSRISSGIKARKKRMGKAYSWGFGSQDNTVQQEAHAKSIQTRQNKAYDNASKIVSMVQYLEGVGITSRKAQVIELEKRNITTTRGCKVTNPAIVRAFKMVEKRNKQLQTA